jgi:hypothetical protein
MKFQTRVKNCTWVHIIYTLLSLHNVTPSTQLHTQVKKINRPLFDRVSFFSSVRFAHGGLRVRVQVRRPGLCRRQRLQGGHFGRNVF